MKRAHFLTLTDSVSANAAKTASRQFSTEDYCLAVPNDQAERSTVAALPMVLDPSLTAPLTALERLQLELLFDGTGPLIAVDAFFAGKRDIQRGLLGATRALNARIVVLGGGPDGERPSSDFVNLPPSPALLAHIVRRAAVTLVPDTDSARVVSKEEICCLGGRALLVGRDFSANALFATMESPTLAAAETPAVDYSSYWKEILSSVNPVVEEAHQGRPRFAIMSTMFPQGGGPPHSSLDLVLALTEIADVTRGPMRTCCQHTGPRSVPFTLLMRSLARAITTKSST